MEDQDLLAAKDEEIERLRAELARARAAAGEAPADWARLETQLRSDANGAAAAGEGKEDVTQPYESVLRGNGTLGFQLVKAFVSVRRDGVENAGIGLSKLFNPSVLAAPFAIQERAVVVSVQDEGVAHGAGVVVGSTLRAINGVSTDSLNYSTVLSTIRAAGRPLRLLFTPPSASQSVAGEAYCNPDTITLEYREATPHSQAAVDRLCEMSAQLGAMLSNVEQTADAVVEKGYAFLAALQKLGSAMGGSAVRKNEPGGGAENIGRGRGHSGSLLSLRPWRPLPGTANCT